METELHAVPSINYYQERLNEALVLQSQNDRYDALRQDAMFIGDDVEPFRQIAADGLLEEQSSTIAELSSKDSAAYDMLAETYEALLAERAMVQESLAEISKQDDGRKARLLAAAKHVVEISSRAKDAADNLARQKIQEIENGNRLRLEQRIGELSVQIAELEETYLVAGQAWPVPEVIRAYDLALEKDIDDEVVIIDEIPLPPENHNVEEVIHGLVEKHGITNGASLKLASILIGYEGRIFLPMELGSVIYTDPTHFEGMTEAQRTLCITQRIHRLLNQGALVKEMLEKEGYVLQYGYRYFKDAKTNKARQRKRRIYRAVPKNTAGDTPETFTQIVDPNDPGVELPLVITRDMLGLGRHRKQELDESAANEAVNSSEERKMLIEIRAIIEKFYALGLLPEDMETKWSAISLKIKMMQNDLRHSNKNSEDDCLHSLYNQAHVYEDHTLHDATSIIIEGMAHLFSKRFAKREKQKQKAKSLVQSALQTFYDNQVNAEQV